MFSLRKPSEKRIRRFLQTQADLDFSYSEVGSTAGDVPAGYSHHDVRVRLGEGEATLDAAKAALRRWAEFETGWIELYWPDTPLEAGRTVAVLAHHLGLWLLNACRIVYVMDEPNVFGFAYGTLPGHAERGEECFQVRLQPEDGSVWYEVQAFFRPNLLPIRVAWPLLHRTVNRFRVDSAAAMKRTIHSPGPRPCPNDSR